MDQIGLSNLKLGLLKEEPIFSGWIALKKKFNFILFVVEFIEMTKCFIIYTTDYSIYAIETRD